MKKLMIALFSLTLISSVGWAQENQPPVTADQDADGHSPECKDPNGSCLKNYNGKPLTRGEVPAVKRVDKLMGTTTKPKDTTPGTSEVDR